MLSEGDLKTRTTSRLRGQMRIPWACLTFLILLGAVCTLWVRSATRADLFAIFTPAGELQGVAADRGSLLLLLSRIPFGRAMGLSMRHESISGDDMRAIHAQIYDSRFSPLAWRGFGAVSGTTTVRRYLPDPFVALSLPYWFVVLGLAGLAGPSTRRFWQSKLRQRRGFCLACGYDLQGTPSARCPECGQAIAGPLACPRWGPIRIALALIALSAVVGLCAWKVWQAHCNANLADLLRRNVPHFASRTAVAREALSRLASETGIAITLDTQGTDPTVRNMDVRDVSMEAILHVMLGRSVTVTSDGPHALRVTDSRPELRCYDVGDLVAEPAAGLADDADHSPAPQRLQNLLQRIALDRQSADLAALDGGRLLVVVTEPAGHESIESALSHLREPLACGGRTALPDFAVMNEVLARRVDRLEFSQAPLDTVIESLARQTGANIVGDTV